MPSTSSRRSNYTASSIASRRRHRTSSASHRSSSQSSSTKSSPKETSFANSRLVNGSIVISALCLINTINFQSFLPQTGDSYLRRRFLLGPPKLSEAQISRSRSHHLFPVDYMPDGVETTVAWFDHETAPHEDMLSLYQCMGENIAIHSRYGVGDAARFRVYMNGKTKVLDMSKFRDTMALNHDLLILTNEPYDTVNQLFDRENRGRMFALFDNPVHRTIQRFMNREGEGLKMSLLDWVRSADNSQDNIFVKRILGKRPSEQVNLVDLQMAKEFIRQSAVVGLTSQMKESFMRFNVAMGTNGSQMMSSVKCLEDIFRKSGSDSDKITKMFPQHSREWNAIAKRNYLDMALYAYIEKLFEEYDGVFNFFPQEVEDDLEDEAENLVATSTKKVNEGSGDRTTEQEHGRQETAEEREVRLMKDSPYDGSDNEHPAVESEESKETLISTSDPKAALKRRLADVSSFEFGGDKATTPFFWHVPKAGGTAIQNLYWCMGLTLANEVGGNPKLLQRKKVPRNKLTVFQPWKASGNMAKVINVDVTSHAGIDNAKKLGFLTQEGQPKTDFVSSSLFHVVSMKMFDKDQKARMFALFRHPVERAVSKFYYLSKATWEPTYDETWANMTLEEWATNDRGENNWLTHHLSGKKHFETVDRHDLEMAKEMIKTKFIIGMMNKFDESVHRFNLLLGVDENDSSNKQCMAEFSHSDDQKSKKRVMANRNSYTKAEEGSKAWNMIAEINALDVELFSFIEEQFNVQKHLFEQYEAQRIIFQQLQTQQNVKTN